MAIASRFRDYLQQVSHTTLELFAHAYSYPFLVSIAEETVPEQTIADTAAMSAIDDERMNMGELLALTPDACLVFPLCEDSARRGRARINVGRSQDNDVVLSSSSVSKRHAQFFTGTEGLMNIKDLGSRNGTFVNGRKLAQGEVVVLRSEDRMTFGMVDCQLMSSADLFRFLAELSPS